jgi:hypothetical protein
MSLYNMLCGMNTGLLVVISSIIGMRIERTFPRFRDIFTTVEDTDIKADFYVYTRMGGNNSFCWEGKTEDDCTCPACQLNRLIDENPQIVGSYDDTFDNTYRTICMNFTPEQKVCFNRFLEGKFIQEDVDKINSLLKEAQSE